MNASTSGHKVEVISKEMIKPSSPTPHHLKNYKLSLLDQIAPPSYIPIIFFYEANDHSSTNYDQISQKLKQSLSESLALFYPLAGKLDHETFTIDCNDAGVEYTEARVLQTRLLDVIHNPALEHLKDYIPVNVRDDGMSPILLLAVQISFFDCGGIAIGVCMWHQIGDATSATAFVNSWASICRGGEGPPQPCLGFLARHFPARDLHTWNNATAITPCISNEKTMTKRYLFDKEKLEALKVLFHSSSDSSWNTVKNPTRVELVSAFLWKHFINDKWNQKNILAASHVVNLRPRSKSGDHDHDLEVEHLFGNFYLHAVAITGATLEQYEPGMGKLVNMLRHSIMRIVDGEVLKNAGSIGDAILGEYEDFMDQVSKGVIDYCLISSWCRFPVYEVDYGWGKPVWVGTTPTHLNNITSLWGTKCADDIEAWVSMTTKNISSFDIEYTLLGNTVKP